MSTTFCSATDDYMTTYLDTYWYRNICHATVRYHSRPRPTTTSLSAKRIITQKGDSRGTLFKVLRYKSVGHSFDPTLFREVECDCINIIRGAADNMSQLQRTGSFENCVPAQKAGASRKQTGNHGIMGGSGCEGGHFKTHDNCGYGDRHVCTRIYGSVTASF